MSEPYVGQIIMFAGDFAPNGWALCDGRLLAIADFELLFTVIGTTYGGDGKKTFALPDLRGRVPVAAGQGPGLSSYAFNEAFGFEAVTLETHHLGKHNHPVAAVSQPGNYNIPAGNLLLSALGGDAQPPLPAYGPLLSYEGLDGNTISPAGADQPHSNMQPYQCVNYCIALTGVIPPQA